MRGGARRGLEAVVLPRGGRPALPDLGPDERVAFRGGVATDPAGHPARGGLGGGALRAGRAEHRPAPVRQRPSHLRLGTAPGPGQHGGGGGARRGHDASRRLDHRRRPGGGPGRGADRGGGHPAGSDERQGLPDREMAQGSEVRVGEPGASPPGPAGKPRASPPGRGGGEQPEGSGRGGAPGALRLRDGAEREREIDACQPGAQAGPAPEAGRRRGRASGEARVAGRGGGRWPGRGRGPEADREKPPFQPGHLHGGDGPSAGDLRPAPAFPRAGLQGGAVQLQREGRALREMPGRRAAQDRHALSGRCLHPLRFLRGTAIQPGDAGGRLPGAQHFPRCWR